MLSELKSAWLQKFLVMDITQCSRLFWLVTMRSTLSLITYFLMGTVSFAVENSPIYVPKPLIPNPDVKRDTVLRIERFATCENCPWYEIKIYEDSRDMFVGKDGIRELGVRGSYVAGSKALGSGVRVDGVEDSLDQINRVINRIDNLWDVLQSMQQEGNPNNLGKSVQLVELEISKAGVHRKVRFNLFPSSDQRVVQLLNDVEKLSWFRRSGGPIAVAPRKPFFADSEAVLYLRYPLYPLEECDGADYPDDLIVVLYRDGHVYAEQVRALREAVKKDADIPKLTLEIGMARVDELRESLLAAANGLGRAQVTPYTRSPESGLPPAYRLIPQISRLYVKDGKGGVRDLSAALTQINRSESLWPENQKTKVLAMVRDVRSLLPQADPQKIDACRKALPRR